MRLNALRACGRCGAEFTPGHQRGRYCSATCRAAAWRETRAQTTKAATDEARQQRDDELRVLVLAVQQAAEALARRLADPK